MTEGLVTLERRGAVAVISLNRPGRHNALIPELLSDLLAALENRRCQEARALLLRAEGYSFSTGGDIGGFQQHRAAIGEYAQQLVGLLNQVILALYKHPTAVVCAVQGQVTGGSLGLLLASDRVVMQRDATVTPWYTAVGFSPDGGWKAMLPDIIGQQQATQWLLSNACYSAETCRELGLVDQVVDEDCDAVAMGWAESIAAPQVDDVTRGRRFPDRNHEALRCRLEVEREAFVAQVQTRQALAGIDRFLKRH